MSHKTTLLLARHGNTFAKGDVILRVGGRTDLPLTEEKLGTSLGLYLKRENLLPDVVFAAPLKRTTQTAEQAVNAMGIGQDIIKDDRLIEIDYGPDEGKPEEDVVARLGEEALQKWNDDATVPDGWKVDPQAIINMWHQIAKETEEKYKGKRVLIVTSNGILRFSPHLTGDFNGFAKDHDIKVATGGLCIFEKEESDENWTCSGWNLRPHKIFESES
ncbi:MAG: histidine phosphatase family protein [Alphaproteobacteria bacterium]|nr:histidine phosphatase family protein [Alphaproteobacteria bacterium]MBN2780163.1 histidine phosphatase family protein [Alphaproteobacteria bacterium]